MIPLTPLPVLTVVPPTERMARRGTDLGAPAVKVAPPATAGVPAGAYVANEPKVTVHHLARQALISIRQSSPTQVQRHPESARRRVPPGRWLGRARPAPGLAGRAGDGHR